MRARVQGIAQHLKALGYQAKLVLASAFSSEYAPLDLNVSLAGDQSNEILAPNLGVVEGAAFEYCNGVTLLKSRRHLELAKHIY